MFFCFVFSLDERHRFSAAGITYLLPLMALIMAENENIKDATREDAIVVLHDHAHLGSSLLIPHFKVYLSA